MSPSLDSTRPRPRVRFLRPERVPTWRDDAGGDSPHVERAAFIAGYSADATVSRSLAVLATELDAAGYAVVLVVASASLAPLRWDASPPPNITVLRKPDIGYDFGSWAVGLNRFPELAERPSVLLVNDSLAGPFGPLSPVLESFERSTGDVWGATRSSQVTQHLQSYFLGFRGGVLANSPLRRFFEALPLVEGKMAMVEAYELGLSRLALGEAFVVDAMFEPEGLGAVGLNPTLVGWRQLLERGFPFVKRQLLRERALATDALDIESVVAAVYGARVADWVPVESRGYST